MDDLERISFSSKLMMIPVFTGKKDEWGRFKVKLQAALEEADLLDTLESEETRCTRDQCHAGAEGCPSQNG